METITKKCPAPDCPRGDEEQPIANFTTAFGRRYSRCHPCRHAYDDAAYLRRMRNPEKKLKETQRQSMCRWKKAGYIKEKHSIAYFGASIGDVIQHLNNGLPKDVTLEMAQAQGWHLDHIIPRASFNYLIAFHVDVAEHYTNLQLLPAKENLRKSDSVPDGFNINAFVAQKITELGLI